MVPAAYPDQVEPARFGYVIIMPIQSHLPPLRSERPFLALDQVGPITDRSSTSFWPSEVVPAAPAQAVDLDPELLPHIAITCIHDGSAIPSDFLTRQGRPVDPAEIEALYARERDWGAGLVAAELAGALGVSGFLHIHIARVLMDFGRFPGLTPLNAGYMERLAINSPFAQWLDFDQKWALLERCYDRISDHMDRDVCRKVLTIGVHTYDVYNASGTLRPEISIINRLQAYQQHSRMPYGIFDPLYPDGLGEYTCDRVLPSRVSLHLERNGVPVALNFPYCLPEGSVEVRSQVWHFFDFVRERLHEVAPGIVEDPIYDLVWDMLLDTNLRSSESQALRSTLHLFRTAPRGRKREFEAARRAYNHIEGFVHGNGGALIDDYRFDGGRPGAIGIEIRKDLVWEFDRKGNPVGPRRDNAQKLARLIAEALELYFRTDRTRRIPFNEAIRRHRLPHHLAPV